MANAAATIYRARHQRCTCIETYPDLFDGEVKSDSNSLKNTVIGADTVDFSNNFDQINDTSVLDFYAFRFAGRARGVNDVT